MKSIWYVILLYFITFSSVSAQESETVEPVSDTSNADLDNDDPTSATDDEYGDPGTNEDKDDPVNNGNGDNNKTKNAQPNDGDTNQKSIVPTQLSESADSFVRGSLEYIMVSTRLKFSQVKLICQENYNGVLAVVSDEKIAKFLSEALSETNLDLDSLWIGGENKTTEEKSGWYWTSYEKVEPIDTPLYKKLLAMNDDIADNRMCLAFGRSDHQTPQFRPLRCTALRSFICERRRVGGLSEGNSTHPGWITAAKRRYKIFYDTVSWERASTRCARYDINAVLAVVPNYVVSQLLGRYLLVGRPSMENAWIGARFDDEIAAYRFESEPDQPLSNNTVKDYPPWKTSSITRSDACVLLDRHLSNITLFVEARCERLRSYICSIDSTDSKDVHHSVDLIFGNHGYRYFYDMVPWQEAYETCEQYSDFKGKLVEITEPEQLVHLLYIMGENRTDTRHLWIGGKYKKNDWVWASSDNKIDKKQLNFVANLTYTDDVESMNTCLNMDRENHIAALHYGTDCSWLQNFACYFSADELRRLEAAEKKGGNGGTGNQPDSK